MATPPINVRTVENVLETLKRGQRELARNPRGAVEAAVKQLLSLGPARAHPEAKTYRIDDLARVSGVTVRNIRAYQERDLLHPPRREGRVAIFDDSHLSRLKIITSMLERGYTTAHITEMLQAWEGGLDISDVLGLENALVPPRIEDPATMMTLAEVRDLAGDKEALLAYVDAGLVEIKGANVLVKRPDLLRAFAEMRGFGMPVEALVRLHTDVATRVDEISRDLVNEGVKQVGARLSSPTEPSSAELGEVVATMTRFRELAMSTVTATLAESMERTIEGLLADYLAQTVATGAEDVG
ncbi:MerR family transcriptional regulator [Nocardioides marmorisolisilvae]|uniref:MerR family transcriptional regulator n=1 Tax=Nocardioides marmorisolisilvae TaxID=1542737 RepID=A0A3N0DQ51_9ACTN|nr:MerR family transcriptional regulator [Nocardioides marmorisolisilvae]RNL77777.1 MerR family transcriptional regulator [Nocardioides marmorisolisilvae]